MSSPRHRKAPPRPITILYGIVVLALAAWLVVYWRGGCRKPELDKGGAAEREGKLAEAVEHYKSLLRRYPNDREAAWRIARIYCHKEKQPDLCVQWADRLRAIYPSDDRYRLAAAEGHLERGLRYMASGDRVAAEASLLEAAKLSPESWTAADELARLYEAAGNAARTSEWQAKRDALPEPTPTKRAP